MAPQTPAEMVPGKQVTVTFPEKPLLHGYEVTPLTVTSMVAGKPTFACGGGQLSLGQ